MSEFRQDPFYGHEVLIAPQRLRRPNAVTCAPWPASDPAECPFCRGHEDQTPQHLLEIPSPDWQVRVLPNRYPAVSAEFANGHHEVIVESPEHVAGLLALSPDHRRLVFETYRGRFRDAAKQGAFSCALLFKNHGPSAGATQYHIHSQFMALTELLSSVRQLCHTTAQHSAAHGSCMFCDWIQDERRLGHRIVKQTDNLIVICPAASRTPYEMWILPTSHASRWELVGDELLDEICELTSLMLARLEKAVQFAAYNFVIHSAPFDTVFDDHYHWHVVVHPRMASFAGFEMSTGTHINPVPPQTAAQTLRKAQDR